MTKYEPLTQFLNRLQGDHWKPTFLELERMLGFDLPSTAKKKPTWWQAEASTRNGHAKAWADAGWSVHDVDFDKETVNFHRGAAAPAPEAPPSPSLRERLDSGREAAERRLAMAAQQLESAKRQAKDHPLALVSVSSGLAFAAGIGLGYLFVRALNDHDVPQRAESRARDALAALAAGVRGLHETEIPARAESRARDALAAITAGLHEVEHAISERVRKLRA